MILFKHKFMSKKAALSFLKYFLMDFTIIREEALNGFPDNKIYYTDIGHKIIISSNEFNDYWIYETSH